jgi:hypothetical protein
VEIAPHFDLWMRGDRYGTVVKDSKLGVYVLMDKLGKRLRFNRDDLTMIERARNPYGPRAKYRHKRVRSPGRFRRGSLRLTKERKGVRVVVGKLKRSRRRVTRGPRRGRAALAVQAILTRKRGRNPVAYSEKKAWLAVQEIADRLARYAVSLHKQGRGEEWLEAETEARILLGLAEYMQEQLARGVHVNPALAVFGNPRKARVLSNDVQAVLYRHAADGLDYVHPFGKGVAVKNKRDGSTVIRAAVSARSGVRATLLENGSVLLRHPTKPLWGNF